MFYFFSLVFFSFSLTFNLICDTEYNIESNGKVEVVTEHLYSKSHYFRNFKIIGTFEDNLGNYDSNDASVSAEYKNGEVINLQWSSKLIY